MEEDPELSAIVILEASGDPAEALDFFRAEGFEVAEAFGTTFSISAPRSGFERLFGEPIEVRASGERVMSARTSRGEELDATRLPKHVSRSLQAVTFTRPPDFGPTAI
ncbi:MAG: hypothetical protein ACRDJ5_05565 [Actinomycetota bacterium]